MTTSTVRVHKKGNLTLPIDFRNRYDVGEGDLFTLIDLGDGSFLRTPLISQVNRLGNRITDILANEEISTEALLASLEEEREQYYREHYVKK